MSDKNLLALEDDDLDGVSGGNLSTETVTQTFWTVKQGDTLGAIATQLGIKLADILKMNPWIKNPDKIEVGQKILISKKKHE